MELRYKGFDQERNTRTYRFEGLAAGEANAEFAVTADLALFLLHHVAIQEGPALCAHKLSAEPQGASGSPVELTSDDFRAHTDARAMAEARKAEARKSSARRKAEQ